MKHETTVSLGQKTRHGAKRSRRGFTTMEMLIAVAILVILFALTAPNLIAAQRSLRQKELDAKAETIYVAVQNQLVKLRASGHADRYAIGKDENLLVRAADTGTSIKVGKGAPSDLRPQYDEEGRLIQNIHYLIKTDSQADYVATQKTMDAELLTNHWVIEYDPTNCNVFSVFYSETQDLETDYPNNWSTYNNYRGRTNESKTGRFDKGAWVGYYGGDVASATKTTAELAPTMTITNAEKLTVNMRCANSTGLSLGLLDFKLEITDALGHSWYKVYKVSGFGTLYRPDPLVLDDLSRDVSTNPATGVIDYGTRFANLFNGMNPSYYGSDNLGSTALTPGARLALKLTVSSSNSSVEPGTFGPVYTNGLFADSSTSDTAHIEFARHLQNLDKSAFGGESRFEASTITKAEQRSDVSFKDNEDKADDWYSYYSSQFFNGTSNETASFKPIDNKNLTSYDGKTHRIAGLNVSEDTDAALFEQIRGGVTLKDIRLTGSRVFATADDGRAAALVGSTTATGSAKNLIDGCYVYLEPADYRNKDNTHVWIHGATAGGLVGTAKAGSLRIRESLASTVIDGSTRAGGLVGWVEDGGTVAMSASYADSYLTGPSTGGLAVGNIGTVANCYAAGYQTATGSAAGLVNGAINSSTSCYTICSMAEKEGQSSPTFELYGTAKSIEDKSKTYYFMPSNKDSFNIAGTTSIGTMSNVSLTSALNDGDSDTFTQNSAGQTSPYKLMGQSLSAYTYPRLKGIRHYGDWKTEFEPGAMVYFEKYKDNTYGFDGAGVSEKTLKSNAMVVGDGYGLVYKASDSQPSTITVTVGTFDNYTINTQSATFHTVTGADGTEYHIYPLPTSTIDNDLANEETGYSTTDFYQKVRVATSEEGSEPGYFYFNPYFAKTAMRATEDDPVPTLSEDERVYIRTPRHLYALSLYYDRYYRNPTARCVFVQERGLNYSEYDWEHYTTRLPEDSLSKTINSQGPIGKTDQTYFVAEYDGGCNLIEDVSFETVDDSYVGMFGYSTGMLHNVVLATDYDAHNSEHHFLVKRSDTMGQNDVVSMGVLVGRNNGHVENCAVAGYYLAGSDGTLHTYANSTLYAGGLVGRNEGVIRGCSADTPVIRLSSLYSDVMLGGFVGWNAGSGTIDNCYAIGYLEVAESRGGRGVSASGFAGTNTGEIGESYCASAIVTNGEAATSYGFTPGSATDLRVTDCWYMDRGTYFYVNSLHSYNNVTNRTAATPFIYDASTGQTDDGNPMTGTKADANHSRYHTNTIMGDGEPSSYPFRAVVTDANGNPVHYGDWMNGPAMGNAGMFYWEHEEGGSNSGYHITFVGTSASGVDSGTSLCTAHDDGGKITDFGYGYYVRVGQEDTVRITQAEGLESTVDINEGPGTYNQTASAALHEQMSHYTFYPYTTRKLEDGETGDYVFLNNAVDAQNEKNSGNNRRWGTWTLSVTRPESQNTVDYVYQITPFFANAMRRVESDGGVHVEVTASDWRTTDYTKELGKSGANGGNPYEIRTVQQFQYINWNHDTQNCDTLVFGEKNNASSGNFKQFPFLQYATVLKMGVQDRASVEKLRSPQNWVQSHDLLGASGDSKEVLTPIAGMATSTPVTDGNNENYLYAWFGGNYDGQNYKIQNISVVSEAYTVGLFGATAGAGIKNVILYANDYNEETGEGSRIERNTANITRTFGSKTVDFEVGPGAYNLGGMVGIAYEYKSSNITNKIENCAIAGYHVIDHSTNQQGAGTANVGGLVGLANVNLERCSSVTDIVIDSTHEHGHMAWGSYIRVGGLAGSAGAPEATIAVSDCYTGGVVTISERTLSETPPLDGNGYAIRDQKINNVATGLSTNLFVSGMIGGAYSPNISNFTNRNSNAPDGVATISNCYTFLELPSLEGTVRAVSLFASQADRYYRNSKITLSNCYYLSSIKDAIRHPNREEPSTWPKYFFAASKDTRGGKKKAPNAADWQKMLVEHDQATIDKFKNLVITDAEFEQMLNGDLTCLNQLLHGQKRDDSVERVLGSPAEGITYTNLQNAGVMALNGTRMTDGPWSMVTTRDQSGADITGKYSYSSDESQEGKDYPFPAVVQQKDITYSTQTQTNYVYVHYGRWPLSGWHWSKGRASMDIFEDMGSDGYAQKEFVLKYREVPSEELTVDSFVVDPVDKARVVGVVHDAANSCYRVTVRALRDGYVTITENASQTSASFVLDITARLKLSGDPNRLVLYNGKPDDIAFTATSNSGDRDYSTSSTTGVNPWALQTVEEADADHFIFEVGSQSNLWKVTSDAIGAHTITATYTYDYHTNQGGKSFVEHLSVPTKTLGTIGLSNGDAITLGDESAFNSSRAYRRATADEVEVEQVNLGIPKPSAAQLFLFASAEDADLASFAIGEDITIEPADPNTTINADDYQVTFAARPLSGRVKDSQSGGYYRRWSGSMRYLGTDEPVPVRVSVPVTDPVSGVTYTLFVVVSDIPSRIVHFEPGADDVTGSMEDVALLNKDPYLAPECDYAKIGYTFDGWIVQGEESQKYAVGDSLPIAGFTTVVATWRANTYSVVFDANGGTGETMEPMTLIYDDDPVAFAANTYEPEESYVFAGWNTAADGSGISFADKAEVQNLTDIDGDTITLYAQWMLDRKLSLSWYSAQTSVWATTEYDGVVGSSVGEAYVVPEVAGWTLEGWYTGYTAEDQRVLDATGAVVEDAQDLEGYTTDGEFSFTGNKTLYARWSRQNCYVKVDKIEHVADAEGNYHDDGIYLIASGDTEGQQNLLTVASGDVITNSTVAVNNIATTGGTVFDLEGHESSAFVSSVVADGVRWNFAYTAPPTSARQWNEDYYLVTTLFATKNKYFRGNVQTLELKQDPTWQGAYSNKAMWTYGMLNAHVLQNENQLHENPKNEFCLYWNGSAWKHDAKNKTTYLFKQCDTVYTYYPVSVQE